MQEDTLYRHILKDALRTAWKYKAFWVLGFLAVFWGDIGAYQSLNRAFGELGLFLPRTLALEGPLLPAREAFTTGGFAMLIFLTLIALAFVALVVVAVTSGRGGLIWAIARTKEKKSVPLNSALRRGLECFWPLLGIGVLSRLDIPLYFLILDPVLSAGMGAVQFSLFALAFIFVTLLSIALSFLGLYASAFVVLDDASLLRAIKGSLRLFARHWLVSIELGLILYVITFLLGFGIILALFVLGIPFILAGALAALMQANAGVWFAIVVGALIYLIFLVLVGAAYTTFQYAAWTALFMRLRSGSAIAKVVRLTSRFGHILHRKIV